MAPQVGAVLDTSLWYLQNKEFQYYQVFLHSSIAIKVNIQIIRTFTKLREMLLTHKDLLLKMEEMEKKVIGQDEKIGQTFNYLKQFIKDKEPPRKRIGYKK